MDIFKTLLLNNPPNLALEGQVSYQGTWNASTNSPALTSSVGTKGYYYVVSVAGSTNLDGITDWKVGDWAIYNGTSWQKVDNTDAVASVFGRTGAVVGVSTDYSSVGITNTAIGASNPSTGAFTTLSASGAITSQLSANSAVSTGIIHNNTGSGAGVGSSLSLQSNSTPVAALGWSYNGSAFTTDVKGYGGITITTGNNAGSNTLAATFSGANATLAGNLTVSGNTTLGSGNTYPIYGYSGYFQFAGATAGKFASAGTYRPAAGAASDNYSIQLYNGSSWLEAAYFNSGGATLAGNLTVSGTGTSSFAGITAFKTAAMTNNTIVGEMSDSTTYGLLSFSGSRASSAYLGIAGGGGTDNNLYYSVPTGGVHSFRIAFSEQARINTSGNLLLGTTTDSNNGRLQLATHTTSAGGIGFGTDVSLYRPAAGFLQLDGATFGGLKIKDVAAGAANYIVSDNGSLYIGVTDTPSAANDALIIDSSKNATFAGRIRAIAGTGGSVGYGFTSEVDTGLFLPYSNWATFNVGSSNVLGFLKSYNGANGGMMLVYNLTTAPTANPSGGGFLYAEGGALKWRGSSGTVTTIANA